MLLQKKPSKITKCRRKSPQVTTASSSMVMWCFASPQYLCFYLHNDSKTRKLFYRKLLEFSSTLFSILGVVAALLTTPLSQVHLVDAGTSSFKPETSRMKNAQLSFSRITSTHLSCSKTSIRRLYSPVVQADLHNTYHLSSSTCKFKFIVCYRAVLLTFNILQHWEKNPQAPQLWRKKAPPKDTKIRNSDRSLCPNNNNSGC